MQRHRTTARGILVLIAAALLAVAAASASAASKVPRLIFPVVGGATYYDDFGEPRGGGTHEGNDLMADKKSIAVAAEAGTIKFWTTSAQAGCMLYLYGASGTTYLYIHLNNDLTMANDNRGKCVAGVAYAPGLKSGDKVQAGQPIGFVGDSGDANGIHAHLHFEVHPGDGAAVSPFPYLKKALKLLFFEPDGANFSLVLDGTVVRTDTELGTVTINVGTLREWPSHLRQTKLNRTLTITVPADARIEAAPTAPPALQIPLALASVQLGQKVTLWTSTAPSTVAARAGSAGSLTATRLVLR
jgi:hypothetical protein